MALGSLANLFDKRVALDFRGSSVLNQSYPVGGYVATAAFTPLSLFAAGEQGVWYDPSDLTTMFEDSAGTTPVHTPGNGSADSPVGKILDKSGRGNHATQTTSTARPTLSARYNLLTYTEQFDNAAWSKTGASISANAATDPNGGSTADLIYPSGAAVCYVGAASPPTVPKVSITQKIYAKAAGKNWLYMDLYDGADYNVWFDVQNGLVGTKDASITASITSVGNGWYLCSASRTYTGTLSYASYRVSDSDNSTAITVSGTNGIYIWGADVRVSNDGVGLPAYQRVVDANTYDSVGFPYYLKSDGVDDTLVTGNINFSSTNKLTIFSGYRKLSDTLAMLCEFSSSVSVNNGCFYLFSYSDLKLYFSSKGTIGPQAASLANPAPFTSVISGSSDISAPSVTLRVNAVNQGSDTTTQGTGTYLTYPLYIFSRGSSVYYFNSRLFSLIIRGAFSTSTEIANTETWVNGVTKAY